MLMVLKIKKMAFGYEDLRKHGREPYNVKFKGDFTWMRNLQKHGVFI